MRRQLALANVHAALNQDERLANVHAGFDRDERAEQHDRQAQQS